MVEEVLWKNGRRMIGIFDGLVEKLGMVVNGAGERCNENSLEMLYEE